METQGLTLVPVAAKELLDGVINLRLELDRARYDLWALARRESDTPLGDLLRLRDHEADLLRDVHEAASEVIERLRTNRPATDEIRAWRQAVGIYERTT